MEVGVAQGIAIGVDDFEILMQGADGNEKRVTIEKFCAQTMAQALNGRIDVLQHQ